MDIYAMQVKKEGLSSREHREKVLLSEETLLKAALKQNGLLVSDTLTIRHEPEGRPYLASFPDLGLSITHSGDWVLIALSKDESHIGIDLQQAATMKRDVMTLAHRFYHEDDVKALQEESQPSSLFYRIWTIQEAYGKYTGNGVFAVLGSYPVQFSQHTIGGIPFIELAPPEEGYFLSLCCKNLSCESIHYSCFSSCLSSLI